MDIPEALNGHSQRKNEPDVDGIPHGGKRFWKDASIHSRKRHIKNILVNVEAIHDGLS